MTSEITSTLKGCIPMQPFATATMKSGEARKIFYAITEDYRLIKIFISPAEYEALDIEAKISRAGDPFWLNLGFGNDTQGRQALQAVDEA